MPPLEIKTFEECLTIASTSGGQKHLVLGNGFSVDLFPDIFNYRTLAERIKSDRIKALFESLNTNDFEFVMRKLTDALQIVRLYPENQELMAQIESDLEELKSTLIDVISRSHPENPQAIDDTQYEHCHTFLKHFNNGKKYTFNYDLILYWVYMHFLEHEDRRKRLKSDDGFRHPEDDQTIVTWEIGREHTQYLYYIHGAMHIFHDGSNIEKYTWINGGETITNQVRTSIAAHKYPVFISEGSSAHKMSRIKDNSYLGRTFSSLKNIGGNLFVFGHSLRDEDDHVFNYINQKSNVSNIFISIFGELESGENQRILSKIEDWKQRYENRSYYCYWATSANVWGNQPVVLNVE